MSNAANATHIHAHLHHDHQTAQLITDEVIACDGGGGALGHPRVYLMFHHGATELTCPYCSQVYQLDLDEATGSGH